LILLNNTMKGRISATVDDKTIKKINELLKKGNYRNKSHVIEDAIEKLEVGKR